MDDIRRNPFADTRAADYSDMQIDEYWVDVGNDGDGFFKLVKPTSEIPMLIIGGKGSGKTHVMRYLSSSLQRIRYEGEFIDGVRREGYVGIYMRCSGLNSSRFEGKRQTSETWQRVFAYYMEIWLSQLVVAALEDVVGASATASEEQRFVEHVRDLFDVVDEAFPVDIKTLAEYLKRLQKEIDVAVNNCGFGEEFDVTIRVTSGNLIFGIPEAIGSAFEKLASCVFVYLVDEFENLAEEQQKFINTLLREKRSPSSFKVGARLYGVKTYATYCAGEENKEGSEYERLPLDSRLRANEPQYLAFAQRLICKRLETVGILRDAPSSDDARREFLNQAFAAVDADGTADGATQFVIDNYKDKERPYFATLSSALEIGLKAGVSNGVGNVSDIVAIVTRLRSDQCPLLEKLNCFSFYKAWGSGENLHAAAEQISRDCIDYLNGRREGSYHDRLLHFKYDLLAQLRRECKQKQLYVGFNTLVSLSWGNPRNLLVLLKHVVAWSTFKGERPFADNPISLAAQVAGVKEASDWFFKDAPIVGSEGKYLQDAVARLAELFRTIRYSHKPSECSPCAFSYNDVTANVNARHYIGLAAQRSLLVDIDGGQLDRNSKRIDVKLQINRMLAPRFGLSYYRRGVVPLSSDEVNSIFDPERASEFDGLLDARKQRMMAPFFGSKVRKQDVQGSVQAMFPEMEDD